MTETQPATTTTTSHIPTLLGRTRDILDAAKIHGISITTREAVAIAAANPRDAESLADAISDSGHVPLILAAHPECTLRGDGAVVPEGVYWEASDGCDWISEDAPLDSDAPMVLDDIDVDAWGADTSDGPVHWHVEVRLAVVTAGGYADHLHGSRIITAAQDELEEERERNGGCGRDGHDWHADISVVGGISENPGVWGHGGGVIMHEHCARCGVRRTIDTWADDGRGGHMERTVYRAPDYNSLAYATRLAALAAIKAGHYEENVSRSADLLAVNIDIIASDDAAAIIRGQTIASAFIDSDGDLDLDSDGCGVYLGLCRDDVSDMWKDEDYYVSEVWGRTSENTTIATMEPYQAWEAYVGEQGVEEFLANGGDTLAYVDETETCDHLSGENRLKVAKLLSRYIEMSRA